MTGAAHGVNSGRERTGAAVRPSPVFLAFVVSGWLISLCLHEFGHAYTAWRYGDHAVAVRGYLTLNPARYADAGLSIVLPMIFLVTGGIGLPGGAVYIDRGAIRG